MNRTHGKNGLKKQSKNRINTKWFILGNALLGLFVLLFSYIEITQTREDLKQTVVGEARSLIYTVSNSVKLSLRAAEKSEDNLFYRLNALKELMISTDSVCSNKLENFGIDSVFISYAPSSLPENTWIIDEYDNHLQWHIFKHDSQTINFGLKRSKLLEYRRDVGIGKIMRDLSLNDDIVYCVLQDTIGIVAASENILELSRINHDMFLSEAWETDSFHYRESSFSGKDIIEAALATNTVQGKYLLRMAIGREKSMEIYSRSVNRTIFIAIGLFITGFIVLSFIGSRRKIYTLEEKHDILSNNLDLIMSNITDAVIVLNKDFSFRFFNNAAKELLNINDNSCIGKSYDSIFSDDPFGIKSVAVSQAGSSINQININLGRKNKHIVYSVSFLNYQESTENIIIIIKDMSDIRSLQEKLRQKDKMIAMGHLAAGVAHEIRNPLSAVNIIAQRFEMEFVPEQDKEEYLQLTRTVQNEIGRVNNIIRQFLEFAKPTPIEKSSVEIKDVLENIISLVRPLCQKNQINISSDLCTQTIDLDKDKVTQAILNLCNNAIEAMPNGGSLKISCETDSAYLKISIEDTGSGIPEEHLNKIFNIYFSTKQHGTGLGLSIVYQVVSEHGGEINVESQPNLGTIFKINLPL